MKPTKEYIPMTIGYLIVILYIAFVNNVYVNIVLVLALLIAHFIVYQRVKGTLQSEKTISVNTLQHRLEKTKDEQLEIEDQFLSLSQSFGSGLLMVNDDGLIQYSNADMNDYFNIDFNQMDYQQLTDLKDLYKFINEAFLLETPLQRQIEHEGRIFDLISTPLFKDDMYRGSLILAHDITQIKMAQEYQKRFTADVSHELRTPLSAIKGFSEILLRGDEMNKDDKEEFIRLIHQESNRMEHLLQDLSQVSQLDRLDFELEYATVDIKELIDECINVLKPKLNESNLALYKDVESQMMELDSAKINQVITNIIKNAINYTDEGTIAIKGYREGSRYKLEVTDTGIGIAPDKFDKIFKRFYRVDKARSRETGGSGLGLSISKNAVQKHGGFIQVASEPNKGSTFTIVLPIKE